MTDVSFDEEASRPSRVDSPARGLAGGLIRTGVVKTAGQANMILALLSLIALSAAAYLFIQAQPKPRVPSTAELIRLQQMQSSGQNIR